MNENFRRRVFTPIIMPLTIVGGILLFALSMSRILLAVPEAVSVLIAVAAAAYVLMVAFVVERAKSITAPALAVGLTVGMLGLVGAGAVAASVGIREVHHGEGEEGEGEEVLTEIPEGALVWESAEPALLYTDAPPSGPAGENVIALDNPTGQVHNVVIEGYQNDEVLVETTNGIDVNTITIDAGGYTYYCSIPGHRQAGMEGEITFE